MMAKLGPQAQRGRKEVPGGVSSASLEGFPETGRLGRQMSGLGGLAVPAVPAQHAWLS